MSDDRRHSPGSAADLATGRAIEQRIDRALQAAPEFTVSEDFAARVAAALPPAHPSLAAPSHYGRRAALFCGVVLLISMFAVVPAARHGSRAGSLTELLFSTELVVLALGSGSWYRALRRPN